jgi:hypothetical protein
MPKVKKKFVRKVVSQPYVAPYIPATNPFMYTAGQPAGGLTVNQMFDQTQAQMQAIKDANDYNKALANRDAAFKAGEANAARAAESRAARDRLAAAARNSYNQPKQDFYEKLAENALTGFVSVLPFLLL